jgi:hypothetical protein
LVYTHESDVRFKVGDEKIIPRSTVKEVYASIEADLIYASENLAVCLHKGKSNKRSCIGTLGKAYLYQDNFAKQLL